MRRSLFDPAIFAPGVVRWDFLVHLDPSLPLSDQLVELDEDLLAVTFPNGITLDIGWYPAMSQAGRFRAVLVQDSEDWVPFAKWECRTLEELSEIVAEAVAVAKGPARLK